MKYPVFTGVLQNRGCESDIPRSGGEESHGFGVRLDCDGTGAGGSRCPSRWENKRIKLKKETSQNECRKKWTRRHGCDLNADTEWIYTENMTLDDVENVGASVDQSARWNVHWNCACFMYCRNYRLEATEQRERSWTHQRHNEDHRQRTAGNGRGRRSYFRSAFQVQPTVQILWERRNHHKVSVRKRNSIRVWARVLFWVQFVSSSLASDGNVYPIVGTD